MNRTGLKLFKKNKEKQTNKQLTTKQQCIFNWKMPVHCNPRFLCKYSFNQAWLGLLAHIPWDRALASKESTSTYLTIIWQSWHPKLRDKLSLTDPCLLRYGPRARTSTSKQLPSERALLRFIQGVLTATFPKGSSGPQGHSLCSLWADLGPSAKLTWAGWGKSVCRALIHVHLECK